MFRKFVLPYLLFFVYSVLKATWRVRVIESESMRQAITAGNPIVFAHWHGDELAVIYLLRFYKTGVITSTSKDGELINTIAQLFGARTSRGSSTRGGVTALKGIIRLAREGWNPSVAVDGPKGPYHKVKPGVFEISKIIGAPIYPLGISCDRKFVFEKAWNKTFLPLPFANVICVWGDPLPAIPRDADAHDPDLARGLESALADAGHQARNLIAAP